MHRLRDMFDTLCPMHAELDDTGKITHMGPTLVKVLGGQAVGQSFLDVLELRRPRDITTMADLVAHKGAKLHLKVRNAARTSLKGVLVALPDRDGAVVNLSFGISIVEAVRSYRLTSGDFAATDLAIEMLYLVEAKSAAFEASRKLNQRLQGAMIAAEEQAYTDTLTGLKNRRALDHILERAVEYNTDFALMHLDLDYFKSVNDTMGHAAGDHVLQQVARILVEETRDSDTVARVGGDEFVLVFHNAPDDARLAEISERLIGRLERPIPFGEQNCRISGSIGIVQSRRYDMPDLARMMEDADIALYASKHAGRGCFTLFDDALRLQEALPGSG